jgi:hypothetical protein
MKTRITLLSTASCIALLVATGCSKNEPATAPASRPARSTSEPSTGTVKQAVDASLQQAQTAKQKTEDAATAAAAAASSKVQSLIDQARKYISENRWSEALAVLSELSGQQLSTEQQSIVQSLKEQAQKASQAAATAKATDEAAKAVGGVLPTKK